MLEMLKNRAGQLSESERRLFHIADEDIYWSCPYRAYLVVDENRNRRFYTSII